MTKDGGRNVKSYNQGSFAVDALAASCDGVWRDAANYLETEADIIAYLDAEMAGAGSDPAIIIQALAAVVRTRNLSQLARDTGMSRAGIYKALAEGKNPTFATVAKIARALGLRITFQSINDAVEHDADKNCCA